MKLYVKLILSVAILMTIGGCLIYALKSPLDTKGKYFDDDEYIVSEPTSYSFFEKNGTDNDMRFLKFSGTYLLATFTVDESVVVQVSDDISSGRYKVVLIDPDNNITELQNGITRINGIDGEYRIKMVGDNASGTMRININVDNVGD